MVDRTSYGTNRLMSSCFCGFAFDALLLVGNWIKEDKLSPSEAYFAQIWNEDFFLHGDFLQLVGNLGIHGCIDDLFLQFHSHS